MNGEKKGQSTANPNADAWESLGTGERGTFVMGPEGKLIHKEDYDAAMEAYERKMFQKEHPEEQQAKEKWTSRGWAYMTHWYKEHPDEIDDIILPDSKHDKQYYLDQQAKDPRTIGNLVAEYLAREAQDSNPGTEDGTGTENNPGSENNSNDEPKTDPNGPEDPGVENNPTVDDTDNNGENKENDDNDNSGEKTDNTGEQEDDKEALLRERQKNDERIKAIDEELAKLRGEMDRENKEMIKKLENDLEEAKKVLEERKTDLAESYAKNRRLIVGAKNRAEFDANKRRYAEGLNEYLRAQAKLTYYKGQIDNGAKIESIRDELAKRLESGKITAEEANKELGESWENINKSLQTDISAEFVEGFINEQKALEDSTIDKIDNGNLYRKIVSKMIDNKAIKTTLAIAGAAGLAATGIGLATGALALGGLSYTAGGVALGAGRGALSGLIMSRQSSKNSAVHNFVDEASIRKGLEGIDINNGEDVANVANWLMKQYDSANQTDRGSNRKRTAIATGLGAVIGGVMSGVHIDQNVAKQTEYQRVVGEEPAEYHATNLESVNHAKGYGTQQFYRELGGDGDSYFSSGAHDAMAEVIKKYGMTVGENDWTYPGPVSEWPTAAREAFTEVANEWAKQGLVPATKIGGEPIYDTFTRTTNELISSKLHNFFVDAAAVAEAGALGGTISRMRNQAPANSEMPSLRPATAPNEPMPTRPFAENATEQQPTNNTAEQQPTGNTPEQQPVANPEQQPANGANTGEQPDLAEAIRRSFLNEAGEDGVRFMTDTEGYTDAKGEQIANWWVNLSDEAKNDIVDYENSISSSPLGVALRQWLTLQGYNFNANR